MTSHSRLPVLAALMLGLAACGPPELAVPAPPEPEPTPAAVAAQPPTQAPQPVPETFADGEVLLGMLSVHRLSDTASLTFGGVVDSRCPSDVQCAWAGEAHALIVVSESGQPDAVLAIPVSAMSRAEPALRFRAAAGHRFFLLSLAPMPTMGAAVTNEAYTARLRIEPDPDVMATPAPAGTGEPAAGPSERQDIPGFDDWSEKTLGMGESVLLSDGAGMTLAGVIEARCPSRDACATAGEADVLFLVTIAGQPSEAVSLQWGAKAFHDPARRYKTVAGHRVMLDAIEPAPESDEPIPASAYRATLRFDGRKPQ